MAAYQAQPAEGLQQITNAGKKAYQIALLAIFGVHIAIGAIASHHISDAALDRNEMFAESVISFQNLDADTQALINFKNPYTVSNRIPTGTDDGANTAGASWNVGSAASVGAKWLYKPDGEPKENWEVYECFDASTNDAVWLHSSLSVEDLEDLAFKTQAQLEQDITITTARISNFETALYALSDNRYGQLLGNNTWEGQSTFEDEVTINDSLVLPEFVLNGRSIDSVLTSSDNESLSNTQMVTAGYVAQRLTDLTTSLTQSLTAATTKLTIREATATTSTTGDTELVFNTNNGQVVSIMAIRNDDFYTGYTADLVNNKITFPALEEYDTLSIKVIYQG